MFLYKLNNKLENALLKKNMSTVKIIHYLFEVIELILILKVTLVIFMPLFNFVLC